MNPTANIMVVDDEKSIRLTVERILIRDGYQVVTAESGQAALELIATQEFDLALIDLKLGDIDGTEVLAALRKQSPDTVAIMLTAHASLETALQALRQGAHDYLFKPCQPLELRESIRTGLLKRQQQMRQRNLIHQLGEYFSSNMDEIQAIVAQDAGSNLSLMAEQSDSTTTEPIEAQPGRFLKSDGLIVDFLRRVITLDGHLLELSPTEFGLLAYLISQAPRAVSPQELVLEVQGYESEAWEANETIRVHIYHIRQKIKQATGRTKVIRTVRGMGYAIDE